MSKHMTLVQMQTVLGMHFDVVACNVYVFSKGKNGWSDDIVRTCTHSSQVEID